MAGMTNGAGGNEAHAKEHRDPLLPRRAHQSGSHLINTIALEDDDDNGEDLVDVSSALYSLGSPPPPRFPSLFVCPAPLTWFIIIFVALAVSILLFVPAVKKAVLDDYFGITVKRFFQIWSLPLIAIGFTYVHIYLALAMTFYPVSYKGCCRIPGTNLGCGWQGIVPFKSVKMAQMAVDLMTKKLINVEEIFRRINPADVRAKLSLSLQQSCAPLIDDLGKKYAASIWTALSPNVKQDIIYKMSRNTPDVVVQYLEELQKPGVLTDCLDVEHLVTDKLEKDKDLLSQIFIRCGHQELAFIRDCGAWLGGLFGITQAIIYIYYDEWWVLPTAGFIVGCITNWVALLIIFAPVDPIYIPIPWPKCWAFGCCKRSTKMYNTVCHDHVHRQTIGTKLGLAEITLHGLFTARQAEVAAEYGVVGSEHLLNARSVVHELFTGPRKQKLFDQMVSLIDRHVEKMITDLTSTKFLFNGTMTPLIKPEAIIGKAMMFEVKNDIIAYCMEYLPVWLSNNEILILFDEQLDAKNILREKMSGIPSSQFEGTLHPVFQEDEWLLVLLGGLLGAMIGTFQEVCIN